MSGAFSTALSALQANSRAIEVVGNNLANANTVGFKASSVAFRDLLSQTLGAGVSATQVGMGTAPALALRHFNQGTIQSSAGVLDAAIQGDGLFMLRDSQGNLLYTRSGSFHLDADGHLLTVTGEQVQGWSAVNGVLTTTGPVSGITIPTTGLSQPIATTLFGFDANLNAAGVVGEDSGTFSMPVEVVDSLGTSHVLTIEFTKTDANKWDYEVFIATDEVSSGSGGGGGTTPNPLTSLTTGSLEFDSNGQLTSPAPPTNPPPATGPNGTIQIDITGLVDGASDMTINWALYTSDGTPRMTQYAQTSAVSAMDQDGAQAAQMTRLAMGDGGQLVAQYSNGSSVVVAQLALALIRNPDSLIAVGNNNFQAGADTAEPAVGLPDTGGRGKILGESLEASTVDIATEFTNLIQFQRGYQANSRVITAVDELTQETVNLIR